MNLKNLFHKKTISKTGHQDNDTRYELWSRDTFEGRTFLCAVYDNYEEARAALDRCRRDALSQDEELRDSYWLAGTDLARIAEREREERERFIACRKEEGYDPDHLCMVCDRATDRFVGFLRKNGMHPILDKGVGAEWDHRDDCFNNVGFKMGRSGDHGVFFLSLWIWIRASAHYQGGGISTFILDAPTVVGLCEKLQDPAVRQMLFDKARHLIGQYFKCDRP